MKNSKTVVTKTTKIAPGHSVVETITTIQKVELWPWSPLAGTKSGQLRIGEHEALEECLKKYHQRQLIACSAFFGGDDMPEIGPYCEQENEVARRALENREARSLILEDKDNAWSYGILIFITESCLPNLTNEVFTEARWKDGSDRDQCLGFLQQWGKYRIDNRLNADTKGGLE
jgi:hypothetical protein